MPDSYQRVVDLPVKTDNDISLSNDYLMGIDGNDGYQMLLNDLAKKIVEDYVGSSLGGTSRALKTALDTVSDQIGNTTMGTTATTLTGAIAEHESDISTLNSNLITEMFTGTRASGFDGGRLDGIYNKAANTVILSFVVLRNNTNITANEQLFTISEKYRPSSARNGTVMVLTSSGYTVGTSQVSSSGIVTQGATNVGRLIMGVIMYTI